MREKLLVSEVGKLLNISPHTVRYYLKEGLITPEIDEESEYHLFSMDDVYQLANVMMLRESMIKVKDIRALIADYSKEGYEEKLVESVNNIDAEIKRLKKMKGEIKNTLKTLHQEIGSFEKIYYDERRLLVFDKQEYGQDKSPKEIYDALRSHQEISVNDQTVIYELDNDGMTLCFANDKASDIILPAGQYLTYQVKLNDDSSWEKAINEFFIYSLEQNMLLDERLFTSMAKHAFLVVSEGYLVTIFARILKE